MDKLTLWNKGIRADQNQGNNYFICSECKAEFRSKQCWAKCDCGSLQPLEHHYIEHIKFDVNKQVDDEPLKYYDTKRKPKLELARKEAKSRVTRLHRHLFQCRTCERITEQHDYEKSIPCPCGGVQHIEFTYVGKDEYNANSGRLIEKTIVKNNSPLKALRKQLKLSQGKFAERFNVKQQYISQIENNERPMSKEINSWLQDNSACILRG